VSHHKVQVTVATLWCEKCHTNVAKQHLTIKRNGYLEYAGPACDQCVELAKHWQSEQNQKIEL